MRFDAENITVLGTAGDRKLGGYDFDNKIIEDVISKAKSQGIDIQSDPVARQDLQLKAEEAKKALSAKEKTNIMLNVNGRPFKYTITRDEFVDMAEPLLFRTASSMENACDEAGIEYSDLDKILLVGGSTRMPVVRDAIEEETEIKPSAEVHPDEAVAIGAAYHVIDVLQDIKKKSKSKRDSSSASSNSETSKHTNADIPEMEKQYTFQDVTSHGVGIVCTTKNNGKVNSVILPKNTRVPAEKTRQYSTTVPYQECLSIEVTQGEDEDLRYVTIIGTSTIEIEPRPEIVDIEVYISCDENSIIHVRVYDLDLNRDLGEMTIDRVSNLSEKEIERNRGRISSLDISGD